MPDAFDGEDPEVLDRAQAVAKALKKYYIAEKNRILPDTYKFAKRHDKFANWKSAAIQCIKIGADPATYIRAAFALSGLKTGPYPNSLGGPAALNWYRKYTRSIVTDNLLSEEAIEQINKRPSELIQYVDTETLAEEIKQLRRTLLRLTGTWETCEETLKYLNKFSFPLAPYLRVLLAYPNETTRERFGSEALEFFYQHPNMVLAAKKLNYPMQDIIKWLEKH